MQGTTIDTERMQSYVERLHRRNALEDKLKQVKAEMSGMEQSILDDFAVSGITQMRVNGTTLYIRTERHTSRRDGVGPDEAIAALRAAGWDELVKDSYSASALSAAMRELLDEGSEIPGAIQDAYEVKEVHKLGARNTG
jgi:hypothetical protein